MELNVTLGLEGRVGLVTGASRGIGYAVAQALQQQGVRVGAIARDEEALSKAAAALAGSESGSVLAVPADVTSAASVREACQRAPAMCSSTPSLPA
jgi:NAD(P)-dependent dehydrogenase (short-subunit alcohol dehydrogenase family)